MDDKSITFIIGIYIQLSMVLTKNHILAVVLCLALLCVPVTVLSEDSSAAYEANPTMTDAGYIENQASLFYFAKFVCGGIPSASVTDDSPTKGLGLTMHDNTVYVRLNSLNKDSSYTVTVSEFISADSSTATASFVAKVTGSYNAFVYYSVGEGGLSVYNNGTLIASENVTFNGSFTTTTGSQIYKVEFKDSEGKLIADKTINDLAHFTSICRAEVVDYNESYEDSDLINDLGKGYGFTVTASTKAASKPCYTGNAITGDGYGKYVFVVYVTNVSNATLKIASGDNVYTADAEHTFLNTTATSAAMTSGLGIVAVHEDVLSEKGVSLDSAQFSVGEGDTVYASADIDDHPEEKKSNTLLYVGIGAIAAVVIIAALVAFKMRG